MAVTCPVPVLLGPLNLLANDQIKTAHLTLTVDPEAGTGFFKQKP